MRRVIIMAGLALWFGSCTNSSNEGAATDSSNSSTVTTDTNNASKNTGVDMSGGVNSGSLTADTTGKDSSSNRQ